MSLEVGWKRPIVVIRCLSFVAWPPYNLRFNASLHNLSFYRISYDKAVAFTLHCFCLYLYFYEPTPRSVVKTALGFNEFDNSIISFLYTGYSHKWWQRVTVLFPRFDFGFVPFVKIVLSALVAWRSVRFYSEKRSDIGFESCFPGINEQNNLIFWMQLVEKILTNSGNEWYLAFICNDGCSINLSYV